MFGMKTGFGMFMNPAEQKLGNGGAKSSADVDASLKKENLPEVHFEDKWSAPDGRSVVRVTAFSGNKYEITFLQECKDKSKRGISQFFSDATELQSFFAREGYQLVSSRHSSRPFSEVPAQTKPDLAKIPLGSQEMTDALLKKHFDPHLDGQIVDREDVSVFGMGTESAIPAVSTAGEESIGHDQPSNVIDFEMKRRDLQKTGVESTASSTEESLGKTVTADIEEDASSIEAQERMDALMDEIQSGIDTVQSLIKRNKKAVVLYRLNEWIDTNKERALIAALDAAESGLSRAAELANVDGHEKEALEHLEKMRSDLDISGSLGELRRGGNVVFPKRETDDKKEAVLMSTKEKKREGDKEGFLEKIGQEKHEVLLRYVRDAGIKFRTALTERKVSMALQRTLWNKEAVPYLKESMRAFLADEHLSDSDQFEGFFRDLTKDIFKK